jgi:hypothetical protein
VGPVLGVWVAVVAAAAALFAIVFHAWYQRHPSDVPDPTERQWRPPQINFSSTDVAGNSGGLIFVVGSVVIVAVGLPSVFWFLLAATVAAMCACLGARRVAHEPSEARAAGESDRVALIASSTPVVRRMARCVSQA